MKNIISTGNKSTEDDEYCKCEKPSSVYSVTGEWGYQLRCSDCEKIIEDSFEYYNHYDGEDHCDND